jgi:hypothetical protein
VPTDEPLMPKQRHRELTLKFVDDRELRSVQVFIRVYERVPDEGT